MTNKDPILYRGEMTNVPFHNQACGNCFHSAEMHGRPAENPDAPHFCSECRRIGKECKGFVFKQEYFDELARINPLFMAAKIDALEARITALEQKA
jgi:hypothetical protein